ncbi:hypothetical protein CRE_19823 [Caenorhabditis remanei]|uniref:Uncharacterized protein n=1 Tax=Caenorhabditis remanei TaxID=31234 RepID=E3MTG8_CAERE|nr:hypothetical protein CRE_19823 [Caenorhabditis remanei]
MNFLESYHDTYQTVETLQPTTSAPNNSTTIDQKRFLSNTNNFIIDAIAGVSACVQVILFPFYIYVHRVNNKKDREMPIYPILNHFYHSMIFQNISLFCLSIDAVFLTNFVRDFSLLPILIKALICLLLLSIVTRYMFVKVYVILLSILAIQRFALYFHPTSENHWLFKKNGLRLLIYLIYGLVVCEDLLFLKRSVTYGEDALKPLFSMQIFLTILLISSSMLYIPMYVSVRKLSHLMSSKLNKPHRYIVWQTVLLAVGKVVSGMYSLIEMFNVPLVIQLTYLGCNRHNLKTFLNSFKLTKIWKRVCCCASSSTNSSQVQPYVIFDPQSTNHQLTN